MNLNDYQTLANRTAKPLGAMQLDLNHAALGLATEAGEFTTEVKRAVIYNKPITPETVEHMVEELGDTLWYIALAARALSIPLEQIAAYNIGKLQLRYPDAYTDHLAEARHDKAGLTARES